MRTVRLRVLSAERMRVAPETVFRRLDGLEIQSHAPDNFMRVFSGLR
jgi:hypothetical protein